MKKFRAVLGFNNLNVPSKVEHTRAIVNAMTGNAYFTTPNPTLAVISTNVNAVETAYIAQQSGAHGLLQVTQAKVHTLDLSLDLLLAYVDGIANANPTLAEAIILSANMQLWKANPAKQNGFRIKSSDNVGEVILRTDSAHRATFTFEATQTPADEASWVTLSASTKASFIATELESGARYYFRVAKTDKDGQGEWSVVLNTVVL